MMLEIASARKERGLTQKMFGEMTGIKPSVYPV